MRATSSAITSDVDRISGNFTSDRAASAEEISRIFSLRGLIQLRKETEASLSTSRAQLNDLQIQKDQLDAAAREYPDYFAWAGLAYLTTQTAVLFNWVYFRFDWNLVEPITYLLGYSVVWLSLAFYFGFAKDFSYNNLRSMLEESKRQKLYKERSFNVEKYRELQVRTKNLSELLDQLSDLAPPKSEGKKKPLK